MADAPTHKGVYLLHFERPYKHAQHYLGYAGNIDARLKEHRSGNGARLIEVITEAGIGFMLARVWPYQTRLFERKLKGTHSRLLCPICSPENARFRGRVSAKPFRHRSRRRVMFTKKELAQMRHGYRDARQGLPCSNDATSAYKRGYRRGTARNQERSS